MDSSGVHTIITAIVGIKPGSVDKLRAVLAHLGDPSRVSPITLISTIHFARWVIIDNDTRLLFTSNFDGSWDDYIDEFIEKAADGLDAIWSNCEGFPDGGSRNRDAFKAYVRGHQFTADLFYSAYPDATVKNIGKALRVEKSFEDLLDAMQ
ncbi:MAG: hypothetical protein H0X37_18585 [Herpetosiphonaceae bacterium]|nr:hypothetical protein [Herpetosiphonaceae bacterium]